MNSYNKRRIRDILRLLTALFFSFLAIPHIIIYLSSDTLKNIVNSDLEKKSKTLDLKLNYVLLFIYQIHNDRFYRNIFYHRIGPVLSLLISWLRPEDKYFVISVTTKLGKGAYFAHPFSTEINAESIGCNFSCRNCTTIGNKKDGTNGKRPVIGDNVTIGVNTCIIGDVHIGNNVTIGAGSVVVKDIPDNCIAVGNPCKPIKFINK